MKLLLSSIFLLVAFVGCGETPQPAPNPYAPPAWVSGNVEEGVVASCGTHMKGNSAQEKAAMDRALEKLAKQKESKVSTVANSTQNETASGRYSSSYGSNTSVEANTVVKAHTKAVWRNPMNNQYYIWMIMD